MVIRGGEGSSNGDESWEILGDIKDNDEFKGHGKVSNFKIGKYINKYCNSFRITITTPINDNSSSKKKNKI